MINIVCKNFGHHSAHGGYHQIIRYLDAEALVSPISNSLHELGKFYLLDKIIALIRMNSGMSGYSRDDFLNELAIFPGLLKNKNQIYHFIYGENQYRYLGKLSLLKNRNKNKLIATYHQPPSKFKQVMTHTKHLGQLDAVVVIAANQVECLAEFIDPRKIFLVPHGIDTQYFKPVEERQSGEEIFSIAVGGWLRNFDLMHKVFTALSKLNLNMTHIVVTSQDNIEHLKKMGEVKNVIFKSGVSEVELLSLYRQASLAFIPLKDCTASNAILEAMACGLPIVATDVGGIRDYVSEDCAILSKPGDVEGMAEAIEHLAKNERLRIKMGRLAQERAKEFDWEIVASKMSEVYRTVSKEI